MKLRDAGPADIPAMVAMKGELMTGSYPIDIRLDEHPEWPERAAAAIRDLLPRDTHRLLVVEDGDGRLVGMMTAALELGIPGPRWPGVHAYLADMFVDPAVRGQGVARMLMTEALDWCRARGAGNARLSSTPGAVEVYLKLGFHRPEIGPEGELFPQLWIDF